MQEKSVDNLQVVSGSQVSLAGDPRDRYWTSSQVESQLALASFKSLVSAEIAEMSVESDFVDAFRASWRRYGLGPIELNFLQCDPQRASRSVEMAARDQKTHFELLFAWQGRIQVIHGCERCEVPEGGFVMLSDQVAYGQPLPNRTYTGGLAEPLGVCTSCIGGASFGAWKGLVQTTCGSANGNCRLRS